MVDRTYRTNMWRAATPYCQALQGSEDLWACTAKGCTLLLLQGPIRGARTQTKSVSVLYQGITNEKITVFLFTGLLIFWITLSQGLFACQRKCHRGFWGLFLFLVQHFSSKKQETLRKQNAQQRIFYINNLFIKQNSLLNMLITKYLNTGIWGIFVCEVVEMDFGEQCFIKDGKTVWKDVK